MKGSTAELIIANPNGIICSGCSTKNVSVLTFTTGKITDTSGKLFPASYQRDNGDINIINTGHNLNKKITTISDNIIFTNSKLQSDHIAFDTEHPFSGKEIIINSPDK